MAVACTLASLISCSSSTFVFGSCRVRYPPVPAVCHGLFEPVGGVISAAGDSFTCWPGVSIVPFVSPFKAVPGCACDNGVHDAVSPAR